LINDDDIFNKTYIKRCDLLGGSLIEMIANISSVILNKKDDNIINHLFNFAKYFGLAGQIINDLGDFAGNGKSYTLNKLSDLYNEKLTFPLRLAIIKTGNLSKELIVENLNNPENLSRIKEETLNFIQPYIKEVNQSIRFLNLKNLKTDKIDFASKLLTKSEFII
jgi:geranylgeranyl pyrophosphate synthase